LKKTDFIEQLKPGKVYFRNEDAVKELAYCSAMSFREYLCVLEIFTIFYLCR
jgi:hypothetical protein